jgi:hypothetical protein
MHKELQDGGKLEFRMMNQPEKKRGTLESSFPFSMNGKSNNPQL